MESRTENPPPAEGEPAPSEARKIIARYALLEDRVPAILYVPLWAAWVCKGDIPPTQFASFDAYLDEFPLLVTVTEDCIVVTDPGFGMGAMEWVFRLLHLDDGTELVALTETDAHAENHECKIWIGRYAQDEWEDVTEETLPAITRADFFGDAADAAILEDFELVTLQYSLPRQGLSLQIIPMPNQTLECIDGHVVQDDLDQADEARICAAWLAYEPQPIDCSFDPRLGRFVRS